MDIMLEGEMNGIELSQKINQKHDIPIIYCSAYNDIETVDQAVLTNPYGYILKPIDDRELRATIKIALYKQEMTRKLQKSEERLQFALEASGDTVWDWNIADNKIIYSEQWKNFVEDVAEWQGTPIDKWKEYIHLNDFSEIRKKIEYHLQDQTDIFTAEYRIITDTGQIIWVLNKAKVMQRDENNEPVRMLGTISDIRERKRIEQSIVQSEKKYRTLVETISEGLAIVDDNEQFLYANQAANDKYNLYPQIAENAGLKIVNTYKRPVLNRTEKDKSAYSEIIFHMKEKASG